MDTCISSVTKKAVFLIMVAMAFLSFAGMVMAGDMETCKRCHSDVVENYTESLHYTWRGVEGEYAKGAGADYGLSVPKGCYKCHKPLQNCSCCHEMTGDYGHFGELTPNEKCMKCHKKRPGPNYMGMLAGFKKEGPHADVHYEAGMECKDCHGGDEMHGTASKAPNERMAVEVRCEDCHIVNGTAHEIHKTSVDCAACHSGWMQTCSNCHLETKKIDGSNTDEFYLIVGHEGKIVPAYRMQKTYKNVSTTGWVERTPHTITKDARDCAECHENRNNILCEGCEGRIMIEGGHFITDEMRERILTAEMPSEIEMPTPEVTPKPPGFELVFAVIALMVVAYLVKRSKRRKDRD